MALALLWGPRRLCHFLGPPSLLGHHANTAPNRAGVQVLLQRALMHALLRDLGFSQSPPCSCAEGPSKLCWGFLGIRPAPCTAAKDEDSFSQP